MLHPPSERPAGLAGPRSSALGDERRRIERHGFAVAAGDRLGGHHQTTLWRSNGKSGERQDDLVGAGDIELAGRRDAFAGGAEIRNVICIMAPFPRSSQRDNFASFL
jgi:hypothetical protein